MSGLVFNSLLVGAGGFAGSVSRYLLAVALQRHSLVWPAGALTANLLGCFVIGVLSQLGSAGAAIPPSARLLLAVGFCGGFTTASLRIYETAEFLRDGEYLHAGGYLFLSLAGPLVALYAGLVLVRRLARLSGGLWN